MFTEMFLSGKLNKMKKAYAHQKTMIPDWLFKKDVNVIWDDHDYGINDGGHHIL